jgi:hypothetical protein
MYEMLYTNMQNTRRKAKDGEEPYYDVVYSGYPGERSRMFLRNTGTHQQDYMVTQARRL